MKRFVVTQLLYLLFVWPAFSQTVRPVTASQLESRFRSGKDTVYVVNFWATWCVPCVKELPEFEKFREDHKDQPLKLLLVSMDYESKVKSAVMPFARRQKLKAEILIASRKNEQGFIDAIDKGWSGSLPGTLIVNNAKAVRKFFEKPLTHEELNTLYQTYK
ncbi:TlpA disulfide reductase family protein [Hufsiella ginkgonis]|uniref:Redoxin domain-containing protein n=1 Tax=Hufsiella ginkgonis TaxID=2695274 RepID=A0A7K1XWW9_9SPHI|nr:TlpA disulfide reductase family protein [Hufsiella ginkgonis]MXV15317.1 redoxin domain-containing protein [Hufsiella ginkgonis]